MSRNHKIAVLPGDGIGPEVMIQALEVLDVACAKFGFTVQREKCLVGGAAIDAVGVVLSGRILLQMISQSVVRCYLLESTSVCLLIFAQECVCRR